MNDKITLILDRSNGDLWMDMNGVHTAVIWNVSGLIGNEGFVSVLVRGKRAGSTWNVDEIKEKW